MCTAMRKLRRGTARGKALKFFKRRVMIQIRDIKNTMASGKVGDCSGLIQRLGALVKLRKGIKI